MIKSYIQIILKNEQSCNRGKLISYLGVCNIYIGDKILYIKIHNGVKMNYTNILILMVVCLAYRRKMRRGRTQKSIRCRYLLCSALIPVVGLGEFIFMTMIYN